MTTGNKLDGSKRKRNIWFCIIAGTIAHIIFILLFVLLILRIRIPEVRLRSVSVETANLNSSSSSASPSFNLKLVAQVTVKNNNFGQFKFHNSTAIISYRGTEVGEATIVKARAKARSTKKLNITVSVNSDKVSKNSHLGSDISSKNLTFTAYAKLEGKVHLFLIYKRKIKSAQMNCTFMVNTATKGISNLSCM